MENGFVCCCCCCSSLMFHTMHSMTCECASMHKWITAAVCTRTSSKASSLYVYHTQKKVENMLHYELTNRNAGNIFVSRISTRQPFRRNSFWFVLRCTKKNRLVLLHQNNRPIFQSNLINNRFFCLLWTLNYMLLQANWVPLLLWLLIVIKIIG